MNSNRPTRNRNTNEDNLLFMVNGKNQLGQCGVPHDTSNKRCFVLQEENLPCDAEDIAKVCCGKEHTLLLTKSHILYACGSNKNDQIGVDQGCTENSNVHSFTRIDKLLNCEIVDIDTYSLFTLFLSQSGLVYGVGQNDSFQLGLSHTKKVNEPVLIQALSKHKIIQCAAGENHSLFLTNENKVLGCGGNEDGQLSLNCNFRGNIISPTELQLHGSENGIKSIHSGANHSVFVTMDDYVLACGSNVYGQCGVDNLSYLFSTRFLKVGDQFLKAKKVSCGGRHSIILDPNNRVWVFGHNLYGQLALNHVKEQPIPIDITDILLNAGISDEKIVDIEAGFNYSFFVTSKGRVLACGSNAEFKLGIESNETKTITPETVYIDRNLSSNERLNVACGFFHSVIYKTKVQ